jgi:hypothetical protein
VLLVPPPGSSALPAKLAISVLPGNYIRDITASSTWARLLQLPPQGAAASPADLAAQPAFDHTLQNSHGMPELPELLLTVHTADGQKLQGAAQAKLEWLKLLPGGDGGGVWQLHVPGPSVPVHHKGGADLLRWSKGSLKLPHTAGSAGTYCLKISCSGGARVAGAAGVCVPELVPAALGRVDTGSIPVWWHVIMRGLAAGMLLAGV